MPLVWTLGLGALGLSWSVTTVTTYVPPILDKLVSSSVLVGLALAVEAVFALAVPPVVGPMSDVARSRYGRRRPFMALALAPMVAALVALPFAGTAPTLALALCAFFAAYYVYEPPYRGLYPDLLRDEELGRAQGVQNILRGAAIGASLAGGGFLLALWSPSPFLAAATVAVVACGAVVLLVQEPPGVGRQLRPGPRAELGRSIAIVRASPSVRRFLLASGAWEFAFAGMRAFVVLYFVNGLGRSVATATLALVVVAAGYLTAAVVLSRVGDRVPTRATIFYASLVYGGGLVAAGLAETWHAWYLGLVFTVAVAGGTVMTLAWALLYHIVGPTDHGAASGLGVMARGLGIALGPLVVGGAIDLFRPVLDRTHGYQVVWPVCGLAVLAVAPLVRSLRPNTRPGDIASG